MRFSIHGIQAFLRISGFLECIIGSWLLVHYSFFTFVQECFKGFFSLQKGDHFVEKLSRILLERSHSCRSFTLTKGCLCSDLCTLESLRGALGPSTLQ